MLFGIAPRSGPTCSVDHSVSDIPGTITKRCLGSFSVCGERVSGGMLKANCKVRVDSSCRGGPCLERSLPTLPFQIPTQDSLAEVVTPSSDSIRCHVCGEVIQLASPVTPDAAVRLASSAQQFHPISDNRRPHLRLCHTSPWHCRIEPQMQLILPTDRFQRA